MITITVTEMITPEPALPRLPKGRKFGFLKHDYQVYGVSRPTFTDKANHVLGDPETIKVLYPVFMPMTEAWQWYAADLLALARYRKLYKELNLTQKEIIRTAFKSLYIGKRAFTNGHGWDDGKRDYINNTPGSSPMDQETITTGGNIVELLSGKIRIGGKDVYKVRQLDATKPPPNPLLYNSVMTPWYIVKATNSQRVKILDANNEWTGRWIEDVVEPFPQNGGYDVPVAFMGKGDFNYIDSFRIQSLEDNEIIPSPYHGYIR